MILFHVKSGIRYITRSVFAPIINILGLSVALATCIVLFSYAHRHFSFDKHITDGHSTYRLISRVGDGTFWSRTFACYSDELTNVSAVQKTTGFTLAEDGILQNKNHVVKVKDVAVVDTHFIEFFSLQMHVGDAKAIDEPNVVFLTPETADKMFGSQNVLGKRLFIRKFMGFSGIDTIGHFTVRGVVSPNPETTHFRFDMLVSQKGNLKRLTQAPKKLKVFASNVYVKLYDPTAKNRLEDSLTALAQSYLTDAHGPPLSAFETKLQALYDIHFTSGLNFEQKESVSRLNVLVLLGIGVIIVIIALINFINMYLARLQQRSRAAGVLKVHGAGLKGIWLQVLPEIFMQVLLSTLLAMLYLALAEPYVTKVFEQWHFTVWNFHIILYACLFLFSITFIASIALSYYYGRKSALNLLKKGRGKEQTQMNQSAGMVVFQFAAVIVLLIAMFFIHRQLNFVQTKDLGYDTDNVVVLPFPDRNTQGTVVLDEVSNIPGVVSASTVDHHPMHPYQNINFSLQATNFSFNFRTVDIDALQTLGIELIHAFDDLEKGWIINQTFYKNLQQTFSHDQIAMSKFTSAETTRDDSSEPFVVSAVMNDFHYASLHSPIENFAFRIRSPKTHFNRFLLLQIHPGQTKRVIEDIKKVMTLFYPDLPVEYHMLDDMIQSAYKPEQRLSILISSFSAIAVVIAVMGLLGLSLLMTRRRTKEIGIRKVNGASVWQLVIMFNKEFLRWILLAFITAVPIALFAMRSWLENFAYKTPLHWWVFGMGGALALMIALLTVSVQVWIAARFNPVQALRDE